MGKYKKENGTTRVGDALRWLLKQGKEVAPELLKIAGNVTGIEALEVLASKIGADDKLSEADKQKDRDSVLKMLHVVRSKGYRIVRSDPK